MPVIISKSFRFEAAHYLPQMPEGHKCRRMHGHSFKVTVRLRGDIDPVSGILMDFGEIKQVVKPYIDRLDHWCLNEIGAREGIALLENPTSENLACWLFRELKPRLPALYSIVVDETCTSRCEYME